MLDAINRDLERDLFELIDRDEITNHLDAFEGLERVSGSDAEWEASEYVVDTLRKYGVEAQLEEADAYVSVPESASVEVTAPRSRQIDRATTTAFSASTPGHGVSGRLVHLADVSGPDDTLPDLSGRVLYVPELPKPSFTVAADDAGAEAVLFASPDEHLHQGIVSPLWGTPDAENVADLPDIPVVEVDRTDGEWIEDRLEHGGVEVTVHTSVTTEVTRLPNPVGWIEGAESDRYMVVGNHVDSWFEGITDNATAMAVTLELARIFADQEPRRGLLFGFWSAHSTGRYAGSTSYVDRNFTDLRENGVAYLHIDLSGLDGADSLWYQHMAELEEEHFDAMQSAPNLDVREPEESYLGATGRPARNSDQSFWGAGLSSLLSGARFSPGSERGGPIGGGWWWHTPEDTRDKVDLDVLVEETKLYLALVARICESPILPHDYRETVTDIESVLAEIEEKAEGEVTFDDERDELERLEKGLRAVYERADALEPTDPVDVTLEDLQVRLGNTLNPAFYMSGPDTRNEPSSGWARLPHLREAENLPRLTGREKLFARQSVARGRSRLHSHIRRARRLVSEFDADAADQA